MCLIFIKPKTAKNYLTKDRFENALTNNPHAVGVVYRDGGKVNIQRFVKPESVKEEIWNLIKDKEEYAIHFRYATHGILNLTNTHPFVVTKGLCMMHNGVMSEFGTLNKDWSDTKNFVEYFLKPYVEEEGIGVVHNKEFKEDLEKIIGSGNKLLFIDKDFNFSIINEKAGAWREGCWLSNTYSVEPPYSSYYSSYAPKDGTAATSKKSKKYSYDYYNDFMGYNDDDYYDYTNTAKDGKYYSDSWDYLKGTMTIEEINKFMADEIRNGYDFGADIPYELEIDPEWKKGATKEAEDDLMKSIASSVEKGIYTGSVPCNWELVIDKDDIDYLTADKEDEVSPEEAVKIISLPKKEDNSDIQ